MKAKAKTAKRKPAARVNKKLLYMRNAVLQLDEIRRALDRVTAELHVLNHHAGLVIGENVNGAGYLRTLTVDRRGAPWGTTNADA